MMQNDATPGQIGLKNKKGIALLMVLWILILLWVIVGEFSYAVKLRMNIVNNVKGSTHGYYFAIAGINNALAMLLANENSKKDAVPENFLRNITSSMQSTGVTGGYSVNIENESGKININAAEADLLQVLLSGIEMDAEQATIIVDSILDWRDENNLHRTHGAEDDYYLSLDPPYECRDGEFRSPSELLLVKGITQTIFSEIEDMITLYTGSSRGIVPLFAKRTAEKSPNKINVNFAPKQLLQSLPLMTDEQAEEIIIQRDEKYFQNLNDLKKLVGNEIYEAINRYLTVSASSFYSIKAYGFMEGNLSQSVVEAIVEINEELETGFRFVRWKQG